MTRVHFQGQSYEAIFTDPIKLQMALRGLDEPTVIDIIETGKVKMKEIKNKFWVFKSFKKRRDNFISIAISVETPRLIIITAMVNWRPL